MRLLARVGIDEPAAARAKSGILRSFLLALIAVECWERVARIADDPLAERSAVVLALALAGATSGAACAVCLPRLATAATAVAGAAVLVDFVLQLPASPNHQYLQLLVLLLLLLLRDRVGDEVVLRTAVLRWLVVGGLFWAGLQKALYGYWFRGEMLAWAAAQYERFALVVGPLMPAAELERLSTLVLREGAGPFRVDSAIFVLASNVAWLAELVLAALLLVPGTRHLAVFGTLAYFVAIESAAREVFFGGMMAALVLLFGPPTWLQRARPFGFAGLGLLFATSFGLLPRWFFT